MTHIHIHIQSSSIGDCNCKNSGTWGVNTNKIKKPLFCFVGRRMCLGESLAKMEVFLFIANLFHEFTFSFPPEAPPLEVTTFLSNSLYVYKSFSICVKQRQ